METLLSVLLGAIVFAALVLVIRSIAIWIILWREDAQIRQIARQRKWLVATQTKPDIEAVGLLACQRAAQGATFEQIQQDLLGKGWPKRMVVQIVNDAPVAATRMAGILVAGGATTLLCMKELEARPHFTPPVIRLAIFCAVTAHPGSVAATELAGGSDYEWKYCTACNSLA